MKPIVLIYLTLIQEGVKNIEDVPNEYKKEVAQYLDWHTNDCQDDMLPE